MQDTQQGYVDQVLTNVFLSYPNDGFVAEDLFPTLPVPDLTGIAFQLDESHMVNPGSSERAAFARAKRISSNLTETAYGPLREHSLEEPISDLVARTYRTQVEPETIATNHVSGQLLVEKEIAVRDHVTNLNNYATPNKITLSGTSQWSNDASDIEGQIDTAREAVRIGCGHYPTQVTMTVPVRNRLRRHPAIKARLEGAVAITNAQRDAIIADIFQVEKLIIADAVMSDQATGALSGNKSRIWGDDVILQYVSGVKAINELTNGFLLRLNPATNQGNGSPLVGVDKWYEKEIKSTIVRASDFYLPWTVATAAGYIFKDVLA